MEGIAPAEKVVIDYANKSAVDEYLKNEFPDIAPTDKELFYGKLHAYQLAANRTVEEKKEEQRKKRLALATQPWTAEQMYDQAIQMGQLIAAAENFKNGFVVDTHNAEVFKLLCLYFTNDPEFEKHSMNGVGYSLNKGIWLQSEVRGSGKSTLLKCFRVNKRSCFGYLHTTEIASKYQKYGFRDIDMVMGTVPQPPSALNFYQRDAGFMYDELFGDTKVNHMGTPLMVSEYIINSLYDFSNNKKGEMWKFHCTSNADGEDIERISGPTYRSRMPDMFNLIKLDGPNRRIL